MCLDNQLARWPFERREEKHKAAENRFHSNHLVSLEHELVAKCSAKPLVHNPTKYKQVSGVVDLMLGGASGHMLFLG